MPKAKPKTPKTEKMWMAWHIEDGFQPDNWGQTKRESMACLAPEYHESECRPIRVRIVPEAEHQRLTSVSKRNKET